MYRDDNARRLEKLKSVLGPAQRDNIYQATIHDPGAEQQRVAIWYDFQDSVASVLASWITNQFSKDEVVMATILDTRWLRRIQNQELKRNRTMIEWILNAIRHVDAGGEPAKMQSLPGLLLVKNPWGADLRYDDSERPVAEIKTMPLADSERFLQVFDPKSGEMVDAKPGAAQVIAHFDLFGEKGAAPSAIEPSGTSCHDWLDVVRGGVFAPLHSRLNMELAKGILPGTNNEYFKITRENRLYPTFYWEYGKGWSIRVGTDNAIYLLRTADAERRR